MWFVWQGVFAAGWSVVGGVGELVLAGSGDVKVGQQRGDVTEFDVGSLAW
jgi:hypothetical protein